jgi:hypothetical protein
MYIYFNFNGKEECRDVTDDNTTLRMLIEDVYDMKDPTIKDDFDADEPIKDLGLSDGDIVNILRFKVEPDPKLCEELQRATMDGHS